MPSEQETQKTFQCPVCGFHYRAFELAAKCEQWCTTHQSCNLEITKFALESKANSSNN